MELLKEKLLKHIGPCSLMCYTCPAYNNGAISNYAKKLNQYFDGYYEFNARQMPKEYKWWLDELQVFRNKLQRYEVRPCVGCRNNPKPKSGCIEGCPVPKCTHEKGIDFCGECSDFPCDSTSQFFSNISEINYYDWFSGNKRIAEIGLIEYFKEKMNLSHYKSFEKEE